jgi:hypothetical protein
VALRAIAAALCPPLSLAALEAMTADGRLAMNESKRKRRRQRENLAHLVGAWISG